MKYITNLLSSFENLKSIISAYAEGVKNVTYLASLETKLAAKAFNQLLVLGIISVLLLLSTWITILVVLFFALIALNLSFLVAASMIAISNIILLSIACYCMIALKKNLSFPATRRQLANLSQGGIRHE